MPNPPPPPPAPVRAWCWMGPGDNSLSLGRSLPGETQAAARACEEARWAVMPLNRRVTWEQAQAAGYRVIEVEIRAVEPAEAAGER